MTITELKRRFAAGEIDKPGYIRSMLDCHDALFEYAEFIRQTDVRGIEIADGEVVFHLRNMPFSLRCPPSQARVAPLEILNFDRYEPSETSILQAVARDCKTILDIGANMGWFALWFAHHCPGAAIHAFEPLPDSFRFLARNIAANHLENRVTAHEFGLSETAGTFDYFTYPTGSTNASLANVSAAKDAIRHQAMTLRLDDWAAQSGVVPDLLKCDVEGAELLVLRGARTTLAKHRPIVFAEMLRKWSKPFGYHPNDAIAFLANLGYRCHACTDDGLVPFTHMTDESRESNFVFLHTERHAQQLAALPH